MNGILSRFLLGAMRPERVRLFKDLEKAQWLAPEKLEKINRDRTRDLLRHAAANVPFYKAACASAGLDPSQLTSKDLNAFPLISKKEMMADRESFLDSSADQSKFRPNATGGSSGIYFEFFVDESVVEMRMANDLRGRAWTGWRLGDKQAILWGHPRDNKTTHSLRGKILSNFVHRSRNMNAFNMDDDVIAGYYHELKAYKPVMMLGYSSALAFLADYLTRENLNLPAPKGIIASAETLTEEHRRSIESYFCCPLINRYGSREFGVVAQQCEHVEGLHIFNDRVHVEVLRPDGTVCDHGERGEIVITDLDNTVMPFIRYRTGDLARTATGTCSCGRGFPLLETVEGRTSELLVGKNGKYYSCLGPLLFGKGVKGIRQMQILQESVDEIEVKIVPDTAWSQKSKEQITARICELLGDVNVQVTMVEDIPPAPSGKFPFSISKVNPFQ